MSWGVMFREKGGSDESREFKKAAMMAKKGLEMMCELAEEMEDRYSERGSYGEKDDWDMHERRRYYR